MKEKIRQLMLEGWVSKPAVVRAFLWFIAGLILGSLAK